MTDLLTMTACGLYVVAGESPRAWSNFTWTIQVVDMPGRQEDLDAVSLATSELMTQAAQHNTTGQYTVPLDIAFAALHPGTVAPVEFTGLDYADPAVPADVAEEDTGLPQQRWTVCGVFRETWRAAYFPVEAGGPLVAYLRAWEAARRKFGQYLLLAGVHQDWQPSRDAFGYADPWIRDEATMLAKARDEWGVR